MIMTMKTKSETIIEIHRVQGGRASARKAARMGSTLVSHPFGKSRCNGLTNSVHQLFARNELRGSMGG